MHVCIPVDEDKGLQSPVCRHFGSAPMFMLVPLDGSACRVIPNRNQQHAHGQCSPLASLQGESLESVVVGGIGNGALGRLTASGIPVYKTQDTTVDAVMSAYKARTLPLMTSDMSCIHHGHDGHHDHDGH